MSWWGSWDKGISKIASTALKQAQKKIDKVLDIQEGEGANPTSAGVPETSDVSPNDYFFQEWLDVDPVSSIGLVDHFGGSLTTTKPTKSQKSDRSRTSISSLKSDSSRASTASPKLETSKISTANPTLDCSITLDGSESKRFPHKSEDIEERRGSNVERYDKPDHVNQSAMEMDMTYRPNSLKMSDSQVTTVGDWGMTDSTMLMSQFDDILSENTEIENTCAAVDGNNESQGKTDQPAIVEPTELTASVRSDICFDSFKTDAEVSDFITDVDMKHSNTSMKMDNSERTDNEDEESLNTTMVDRASHLSLSSDCTDLTLRGDDGNMGSRGMSPSDQLTVSKDSNDSVYSSRSLHSEPLMESTQKREDEEISDQQKESEKETQHKEEVESRIQSHNASDVIGDDLAFIEACQCDKDSELPLELSLSDQPAEFPCISPPPVQQEVSPTGVVLDECETGTSSDIEVISSSCTSNNGGDLHLPSDGHHVMHGKMKFSRLSSHTRSVSDCSFLSNIIESTNSDENLSQSALSKKLTEIKEVLEVRESKLLQMSKENIDLRETNNILRQQLHQSESARQDEMTDINALTVEFTNRIGEAEKRLQTAAREKEQLKKKIQKLESELCNKPDERRFERMITEKQEQIDELLQEGEKMAQEQLKTNNIVKKLRVKERETDAALQAQTARAAKLEAENEHLKKVIDNRDENEKQHVDAINQLTRAVQKQDKEILQYKRQLEESQEKARSLQTNLEATFKELSELHKSNAAAASEAASATLSAEVAAREHMKAAVAEAESVWTDERRALRSELEELRFSLSSSERESSRREEQLRGEIEYLHSRLSTAEQRNEELTSGLGNATRPVLRQLEALQSSFSAQSTSWEQTERQLNERLVESQKSLSTAAEQERILRERVAELEGRLAAQDSQTTGLRQEKGRLTAALQTEKSRAEVLEEEKHRLLSQLNTGQGQWRTEREDMRKELTLAENTLELTRSQLEVEKRRSVQLSDRAMAAERRAAEVVEQKQRHTSNSSQNSGDSTPRNYRHSASNNSLYAILRYNNASGGAALLEHLQASVQQKDGDIAQLLRDVQHMDKTREALLHDMMDATQRTEVLQEEVTRLQEELTEHEALKNRYNALLQMFGEKMEENEELRLDLQDVKEMYKAQIDLLTQGK